MVYYYYMEHISKVKCDGQKNSTERIIIVSVPLFIPRPLLWAQSHLLVQHSVPAKAVVDVRVVQVDNRPCCNMIKTTNMI